MSWLNIPVAVIEEERPMTETQYYGSLTGVYSRTRVVTWTRTRWVGGDYTAAKAKAAEYAETADAEASVVEQTGGQYHCIVTEKSAGDWSAWEYFTFPYEE